MMKQATLKQLEQMRFTHAVIEVNLAQHGWSKTNGVPLWALVGLGGKVKLTRPVDEYGDGDFVHPVGKVGRLDAIQAKAPGEPLALVEFEVGNLVEMPFECLEAV